MSISLIRLLFGERRHTFRTRLPLPAAIARLREATAATEAGRGRRASIVGSVSEPDVVIRHVEPYARNSWKPAFVGRFEPAGDGADGGAELRGAFRMHWAVRAFHLYVLGFCVMASWIGGVHAWRDPARNGWLLAGVLALFGVFIAIVGLGRGMARNDEAAIAERIRAALDDGRRDGRADADPEADPEAAACAPQADVPS